MAGDWISRAPRTALDDRRIRRARPSDRADDGLLGRVRRSRASDDPPGRRGPDLRERLAMAGTVAALLHACTRRNSRERVRSRHSPAACTRPSRSAAVCRVLRLRRSRAHAGVSARSRCDWCRVYGRADGRQDCGCANRVCEARSSTLTPPHLTIRYDGFKSRARCADRRRQAVRREARSSTRVGVGFGNPSRV
jgi:hypothetical protein